MTCGKAAGGKTAGGKGGGFSMRDGGGGGVYGPRAASQRARRSVSGAKTR